MKGYILRAKGQKGFYKVAWFDVKNICWHDGFTQYSTAEEAIAATKRPGNYRLSYCKDNRPRVDYEEFYVYEKGVIREKPIRERDGTEKAGEDCR